MKKYIFLAQLLFVLNALAQNTSSEDEFRCLRDLRSHMDSSFFHELAGRNTILYFMKENGEAGVGMFDRAHNPTMLVIEDNALLVCNMDFDHKGVINFKIAEEGFDTLKMAYTNATPHFRSSGWFPPRRPCENALTGPTQTTATAALQKIIKQAMRKYLTQNGSAGALPVNCNRAAGLTEYDIQQLRSEVAGAGTTPSGSDSPTSNAEGN